MAIVTSLRWLGELSDDEIVSAIRRGADDAAKRWPELSSTEIAAMRSLAASMSKSRLRAWKDPEPHTAHPTWLEVRALIAGLYGTLE